MYTYIHAYIHTYIHTLYIYIYIEIQEYIIYLCAYTTRKCIFTDFPKLPPGPNDAGGVGAVWYVYICLYVKLVCLCKNSYKQHKVYHCGGISIIDI